MSYENGQMPKNVQKLVKKLADLQLKENWLQLASNGKRIGQEAFTSEMAALEEKGDGLIEELFCTQFALLDIGIIPEDDEFYPDNLRELGEYFLSEYSQDRLAAEIGGEKLDEDLFYAGAYLVRKAKIAEEEAGDDDSWDGDWEEEEDYSEDELREILDQLEQKVRAELNLKEGKTKGKQPEAKIVPLFGDQKKGKKK